MDVCVSLFKMIIRGMWMEWTSNYNIFREKQETEERKDSILKPRKMEISQRVIGIKRRNKMEHLRIVMQMFWRREENRNTSFLLLKFTLENSQLKILKESRTEFTSAVKIKCFPGQTQTNNLHFRKEQHSSAKDDRWISECKVVCEHVNCNHYYNKAY